MKINLNNIVSSLFISFFFIFPVAAEVNHFDRLTLLKNKGFNPKVIYDIGAWRGQWTNSIKQVFPQAQFFLFEANEHQANFLALTSYPYFIALLGDQEKMVTFYSNDSTGDSVYKERTEHYQGSKYKEVTLKMNTLASIFEKNKLPFPDLVKLDVQGAEKLIIEGGGDVIKHAEVVIMEAKILEYNKNAPLIYELMTMMHKFNYLLLDIVEYHYLPTGELNEVDLLFVKNNSSLAKSNSLID